MPVLTAKAFEEKKTTSPAASKRSEIISPQRKAEPKPIWYLIHPDKGFVKDMEITVAGEKLLLADGYTKCQTSEAREELLVQGYRLIFEGKR